MITLSVMSYAQDFLWAKSIGGTGIDIARSMTLDATGNVYTTGAFTGTVDFDPGAGTSNLSSLGGNDVFIQKMDASGNFLWVRSFGASSNDFGNSVALDASGNVYITGYFSGTVDFNPGAGTNYLTSSGGNDIFIQKLDASGNFLWARSFGGPSSDLGNTIDVDASGNVYSIGYFQGTADFNPGAGTYNLTSAGSADIFIQKLDASGNFLWAKSIGGTGVDIGYSIDLDASGNVYTTGYFRNTVDFDPGAGTYNLTSEGNSDAFVQKLDASGNFIWVKSFGGTSTDIGTSIGLDASGNVYTSGYFRNTVDFDPGAGTYNLASEGNSDVFIQKLDASGNFLWARSFGGTNNDISKSIGIDASGNVYTTGYFQIVVDFDPGTGISNLFSAGADDVFIQKLDASGNFLWARSFGGTNTDIGNSIGIDASGDVYTAGYFSGTIDFDPSASVANHTSAGGGDIFVHKLSSCPSTASTHTVTACDSYVFNGITYTTSNNIATQTLTNAAGCDSIITLDLTILHSTTGTHTVTACDSYVFNGITYTASNNTAKDTLTNAAGCDSIVTLDLTITHPTTVTHTVTACDSYVFNGITYTVSNNTAKDTLINASGCDSIVMLDLTIVHPTTGTHTVTACDSYVFNGMTYTASNNTAKDTLINAAGCDSIVTLDLTITHPTTGTHTVTACDSYVFNGITYTASNNTAKDTLTNAAGCDSIITLYLTINTVSDITTTLSGTTITANNTNATYQWLDCKDNNAEISGATNQTYTATASGEYTVELTENSCVDTAVCVVIASTVGIAENSFEGQLRVYPNPTQGDVTLDLGKAHASITVTVYDIHSRLVQTQSFSHTDKVNISLDQPKGVYFVHVASADEKAIVRLIKE